MSETQTAKPTQKTTMKLPSSSVAKIETDLDIIVFRAYRPKTQKPVKINPLPNNAGRHYTGQGITGFYEDMTEELRRKEPFVITPTTTLIISEGKILNCKTNATDKAHWKWVQKHPYIALTKEAGYASRDAVYYVYNEIAVAEAKVSKGENVDKARYKLRFDISSDRRAEIAEALGFPEPRSATPVIVQEWLLDNSELYADTILRLIGDDEGAKVLQKALALFHILHRYKIIEQHRAGMWRWSGENGLVLGATKERAIEFIADPVNADTVSALEAELREKKIQETEI